MHPEPAGTSRGREKRRKDKGPDVDPDPCKPDPIDDTSGERKPRRPDPDWDRLQHRRPLHWTPWLIVRAHATDRGARPLAPSIVYWESPDIWVESSDPGKNAVAGEPNYVHARVFNLGMAPGVPLKVEFYWTAPSLGFGPESMIWIGTEWVEVAPLHTAIVRCNTPWIPISLDGGHECLLVNVSNAILDPITQPFQPTLDRHVGQRNVTVLKGGPGSKLALPLFLYNPWDGPGQTLVAAEAERFVIRTGTDDWRLDRPLLDQLLMFAFTSAAELSAAVREARHEEEHRERHGNARHRPATIVRQPGQTGPISARPDDSTSFLPARNARSQLAQRLIAADQLSRTGALRPAFSSGRLHAGTLEEFERRQLHVEFGVPHDARRGEVIVHRLTQTTNDLNVGGHTIVIEVD